MNGQKFSWFGFLISGGLLFSLFTQCASNESAKKDFLGAWEITDAERDGRSTQTLNGAYFEFTEANYMTTNMMGDDQSYQYEFEADEAQIIQIKPDGNNQIYQIFEVRDDYLELHTIILDFRFKLKMKRVAGPDL